MSPCAPTSAASWTSSRGRWPARCRCAPGRAAAGRSTPRKPFAAAVLAAGRLGAADRLRRRRRLSRCPSTWTPTTPTCWRPAPPSPSPSRTTGGESYRALTVQTDGGLVAVGVPTADVTEATLARLFGLELIVGAVAVTGTAVVGRGRGAARAAAAGPGHAHRPDRGGGARPGRLRPGPPRARGRPEHRGRPAGRGRQHDARRGRARVRRPRTRASSGCAASSPTPRTSCARR